MCGHGRFLSGASACAEESLDLFLRNARGAAQQHARRTGRQPDADGTPGAPQDLAMISQPAAARGLDRHRLQHR